MRQYFLEKLFNINYRISIGKGDTNRRLASETLKILLLSTSEVPNFYKEEFLKLIKLSRITIKNLSSPGLLPIKIKGINNHTAMKYIKLLRDIEEYLRN